MKKLEDMFSGMFGDYLDEEEDDEFKETNPTKLHVSLIDSYNIYATYSIKINSVLVF